VRFEFATAARIAFGPGTLAEVGPFAAATAGDGGTARAFVVTGGTAERTTPVLEVLRGAGVVVATAAVRGEPTTDTVAAVVDRARDFGPTCVVGMGGGSVVDAGKAVAALLTNEGALFDYLEVVGRGAPLLRRPLPYCAVPTTAGTGAEVTRNAVVLSPAHRVKVSMRSPLMLPALAVVDPLLTHSLPPATTASTGLDALIQCLEPLVSHAATPLTDALCREGLTRAARSLRRAYRDGADGEAREDMALASLCGGLALANAKLGAVHGFAGPLGGFLGAPHGLVCAAVLPGVMAANVRALRERAPASPSLGRYDEVARLVTGRPDAVAADAVAWTADLCRDLAVPSLGSVGLTEADIATLVEQSACSSSMRGNPVELTADELTTILREAL